jgi:hypothetical protein
MLQKMQTSSILSWAMVVGLTNSRLHTPIAMTNLLQVVGYWDREFLTLSLC